MMDNKLLVSTPEKTPNQTFAQAWINPSGDRPLNAVVFSW